MKMAGLKRWMRRMAVAAAFLVIAAALAWAFLPKPELLDGIAFSHELYDRNHNLLRVTLTPDEKYRIYTPLDQISPELVQATLLHEDRYYRGYPGINPVSVARPAWNLLFSGRVHAGASTITMQLARIRYQLHTR